MLAYFPEKNNVFSTCKVSTKCFVFHTAEIALNECRSSISSAESGKHTVHEYFMALWKIKERFVANALSDILAFHKQDY